MSTVIDSYSEATRDAANVVYSAVAAWGQSITGDGLALQWVEWFIQRVNSPTGSCYAKLYAHSGVFGASSVPTGAALATSAPINVATLSGSYTLVRFKFLTPYTLVNGTKYCITFEFSGGNASNYVNIGYDGSAPGHGGNAFYYTTGWSAYAAGDTCFYARSSTPTEAAWSVHTIQDNIEHSVIVGGKVYAPALKAGGTGGLYVFDLATGNEDLLYVTSNYLAGSPIVSGGFAFVYDHVAGVIKRVQLSDGSVTHTLSGLSDIDIETVGWDTANSRIIVPLATAIRGYNMADLSQAWTNPITSTQTNAQEGSPVVVGDYIYFRPNNSALLYKLNLSDGTTAGSANVGAPSSAYSYAGPVYDPDHDYVYCPGADGYVACVRVSDMTVIWNVPLGAGMATPRIHNAIGYHNGQVFVPVRDEGANYKAKLFLLDYSDGEILNTNTSAWDDGQDFTTMLLTDTLVVIPGCNYADLYNAKLYVINQSDGTLNTSKALAYSAACGGVACASGGLVIIDELDGFIECFDLGSGTSEDSEHYMKNLYHNGYAGDRLGPSGESLSSDLSDSVTLSDALTKEFSAGRSDAVTLVDAITKAFGKGTIEDEVTLSDFFSKLLYSAFGLQIDDGVSLSDSMAVAFGVQKVDGVTLLDTIVKAAGLGKADGVSLSDAVVKAVGLLKASGLTLSDLISTNVDSIAAAPVLLSRSPMPGESGAAINVPVTFAIQQGGQDPVDLASIVVTINGKNYGYLDDEFVWGGNPSLYQVSVRHPDFQYDETVSVVITASSVFGQLGMDPAVFSFHVRRDPTPTRTVDILTIEEDWVRQGVERYTVNLELWWGRYQKLPYIENMALRVACGDTNARGKEILENGYFSIRIEDGEYVAMYPDTELDLGPMFTNTKKDMSFKLLIPEGAQTTRYFVIELQFEPKVAFLYGATCVGFGIYMDAGNLIALNPTTHLYRAYVFNQAMWNDLTRVGIVASPLWRGMDKKW